jgi:hypothetical protein
MTQRSILSFMSLALALWAQTAGPVLVAPANPQTPSPAFLAARAAEAYNEWRDFQPGLLAELFSRPSSQVLADLEKKKERMEKYKQAEDEFYAGLSAEVQHDLDTLAKISKAAWPAYQRQRTQSALRNVGMIREQELRIEQEIQSLAGRTDHDGVLHRSSLEVQLKTLVDTRRQLSNDLADMAAATPDASASLSKAVELQKQRVDQLQRLRDLDAESRKSLAAMYDSSARAVKLHAAAQPVTAGPPSPLPPPAPGNHQAEPADTPVQLPGQPHRTAGRVEWAPAADGSYPRVQFIIEDWSESQPRATLRVWTRDTRSSLIDLPFRCQVGPQQLECICTYPRGSVSLHSATLITDAPPETLTLVGEVYASAAAGPWKGENVALKLVASPH